jgi:hypothetical protein
MSATCGLFALLFGCGDGGTRGEGEASGAATDPSDPSTTALTTGITTDDETSGASGATSGAAEDTSGGDDTGGSFVARPDGGVSGMCDVWSQDCPEGEKCTPVLLNGAVTPVCVSVMPNPGQVGDPCTRDGVTGEDSCDVGILCVPDPNPELMRCFALCTGSPADPMCEGDKDVCVIADGGATPICFPNCDPLLQDCNIDGWGCFPDGAGGYVCAPDQSAGANHQGDMCGPSYNTCEAGLVCSGAVAGCEGGGCCSPYCDLSAPDPNSQCPGVAMGEECLDIYTDPAPEFQNVGLCAVPM